MIEKINRTFRSLEEMNFTENKFPLDTKNGAIAQKS